MRSGIVRGRASAGTGLPGPRKQGATGRGNASKALRHRNYRLFLAGEIVSDTGTWMQRVAEDRIVLERHVCLIAALLGVLIAVDIPTRQAS
ncbi:hypothetical protein AB0M92_12450 [Streptomyces sp. NPDC051582]|uniref:hypothetical protein n=1 Tax=Streptomyces sp. NPDC051582 TaxID=3155167 RepID=UPI0034233F48